MKIYTIEVASAIEHELKGFLKDWGSGYPMRFTRFVDLGGKQTDLYVYTAQAGASPWMIIRVRSVVKDEEGECMQVFVRVAGKTEGMEEILVSPENWKLPALADRVLTFCKNDMLGKVAEGGADLPAPDESSASSLGSGSSSDDDDEDYDDLDTSGILAGGGDSGGDSDFNPEDVIASANAEGDAGDAVDDPSDLIKQMNEMSDDES